MKFKNVIFDWSGVIKDLLEDHLWIVNKMMVHFGVKEITLEEMRENLVQPYMIFWNKYMPDLSLEEERKVYKELILSKDCPVSDAYEGIVELIKELKKRNIHMAILSSDLPDTVFPEMKRYGLDGIFDDTIVHIHDKAEAIHELMVKNKFKPEETVFIGDTNHEIEVGKQVGTKTIAVTWGIGTEEKLKLLNPDYLVRNIKELEAILLS